MAFWFANVSDEFKNQKNFSYFTHQPVFQQMKSDLNYKAPEFRSPINSPLVSPRNELSMSLDLIDQDFHSHSSPSRPSSNQV